MLFFIGIGVLIFISLIELNPKHFRKSFPHQETDNYSGVILTVTSILVGIVSCIGKIAGILIIDSSLNSAYILYGILLVGIGFALRYSAMRILKEDYNYAVAPIKKLKINGIYQKIRHPAYLGTLLYAIGTPLIFLSLLGFFAALIVFFSVFYRINVEEKFLAKILGNKYLEYMRHTWRMVPYVY